VIERLQEAVHYHTPRGFDIPGAFSMNHAARRKATGTGRVRSIASVIPELLSRFSSVT